VRFIFNPPPRFPFIVKALNEQANFGMMALACTAYKTFDQLQDADAIAAS
jgi:hypothetical protein